MDVGQQRPRRRAGDFRSRSNTAPPQALTAQLGAINASQIAHHQVVGSAFATVRDLVLRHGHSYTRKPLPRGRWSRAPQACFANALAAALTGRWVYVEGFAMHRPGGLAVLHAWVTDPQQPTLAYDPTWKQGHEYFGIPFTLEYVLRVHARGGRAGVLDAWELGWPLLRGDDRIADAVWTAA